MLFSIVFVEAKQKVLPQVYSTWKQLKSLDKFLAKIVIMFYLAIFSY